MHGWAGTSRPGNPWQAAAERALGLGQRGARLWPLTPGLSGSRPGRGW